MEVSRKTMVISVKGLNDDQIQEEFTDFFQNLVEKYGVNFGCSLSKMQENTEAEKQILILAELSV